MIKMCGPKNSRYTYTGSRCPHTDLAFEVEAKTLSEALFKYEKHFKVAISPAPADHPAISGDVAKYFVHVDLERGSSQLVDIHILRAGTDICVKQNANFELYPHDLIELGELIC